MDGRTNGFDYALRLFRGKNVRRQKVLREKKSRNWRHAFSREKSFAIAENWGKNTIFIYFQLCLAEKFATKAKARKSMESLPYIWILVSESIFLFNHVDIWKRTTKTTSRKICRRQNKKATRSFRSRASNYKIEHGHGGNTFIFIKLFFSCHLRISNLFPYFLGKKASKSKEIRC